MCVHVGCIFGLYQDVYIVKELSNFVTVDRRFNAISQ